MTPLELDDQATAILEMDRDAYGPGATRYGKRFGIIFPRGLLRRSEREMPVGMAPDPAVRQGIFNRASNTRQVWLNGHLRGMTTPSHDPHRTPMSITRDEVSWPLRGDTFQEK